jgi:hypothetical protein
MLLGDEGIAQWWSRLGMSFSAVVNIVHLLINVYTFYLVYAVEHGMYDAFIIRVMTSIPIAKDRLIREKSNKVI